MRALVEDVTHELAHPWAAAVRRASVSRFDDLNDHLDLALARTDLGVDRLPLWAGLVRVLQWLLILTAIGAAVWTGLIFASDYLQIPDLRVPDWRGYPVPLLLLVGAVALGILLALVCRLLVSLTARRRARAADRRLRGAISEVTQQLVVTPVEAELAAYAEARHGLTAALG